MQKIECLITAVSSSSQRTPVPVFAVLSVVENNVYKKENNS